jgi:DNA-directed RNA polymerase beta' subunit
MPMRMIKKTSKKKMTMKLMTRKFFSHIEKNRLLTLRKYKRKHKIIKMKKIPFLRLASPEEIIRWGERFSIDGSLIGEVSDFSMDSIKQPTVNGFFSEQIFGPVEKPYICACEKETDNIHNFTNIFVYWVIEVMYAHSQKHLHLQTSEDIYLSYICSKCGVELDYEVVFEMPKQKRKRFTSFGHIKSEIPLIHPLFSSFLSCFLFWSKDEEIQTLYSLFSFGYFPLIQHWTFFSSQSYYYYLQGDSSFFQKEKENTFYPSLIQKKKNLLYFYLPEVSLIYFSLSKRIGNIIKKDHFLYFYGLNSRKSWSLNTTDRAEFPLFIDFFWFADEIIFDKPQIPYLLKQRHSLERVLHIDYPSYIAFTDEITFLISTEIPEMIFLEDYFLFHKMSLLYIFYQSFLFEKISQKESFMVSVLSKKIFELDIYDTLSFFLTNITKKKKNTNNFDFEIKKNSLIFDFIYIKIIYFSKLKYLTSFLLKRIHFVFSQNEMKALYFEVFFHLFQNQTQKAFIKDSSMLNLLFLKFKINIMEKYLKPSDFFLNEKAEKKARKKFFSRRNSKYKKSYKNWMKLFQNQYKKMIKKIKKNIIILKNFQNFSSGNLNPFWILLRRILVLPPEYRPYIDYGNQNEIVLLDFLEERNAEVPTLFISDVNHFYRELLHSTHIYSQFIWNPLFSAFLYRPQPFDGEIIHFLDSDLYCNFLFSMRALEFREISHYWRLRFFLALNIQKNLNNLINMSDRHPTYSRSFGIPKPKLPRKSLLDRLIGKKGFIRQYLLGKRVDYSGRSVISSAPHLDIYECGLPFELALTLFQPFLKKFYRLDFWLVDYMNYLEYKTQYMNDIETDLYFMINKKKAKKKKGINYFVDESQETPLNDFQRIEGDIDSQYEMNILWVVLNHYCKMNPILLNRAPTLHRKGIQSFLPRLTMNQSIELHPLVCPAFNADFDGDQMAIHLPVTESSRIEAFHILWSGLDIFSTANEDPLVSPAQDMILGLNYLTLLPSITISSNKILHQFFWRNFSDILIMVNKRKSYIQTEEEEKEKELLFQWFSWSYWSFSFLKDLLFFFSEKLEKNFIELQFLETSSYQKPGKNSVIFGRSLATHTFFQNHKIFIKTTLGRSSLSDFLLIHSPKMEFFFQNIFKNIKKDSFGFPIISFDSDIIANAFLCLFYSRVFQEYFQKHQQEYKLPEDNWNIDKKEKEIQYFLFSPYTLNMKFSVYSLFFFSESKKKEKEMDKKQIYIIAKLLDLFFDIYFFYYKDIIQVWNQRKDSFGIWNQRKTVKNYEFFLFFIHETYKKYHPKYISFGFFFKEIDLTRKKKIEIYDMFFTDDGILPLTEFTKYWIYSHFEESENDVFQKNALNLWYACYSEFHKKNNRKYFINSFRFQDFQNVPYNKHINDLVEKFKVLHFHQEDFTCVLLDDEDAYINTKDGEIKKMIDNENVNQIITNSFSHVDFDTLNLNDFLDHFYENPSEIFQLLLPFGNFLKEILWKKDEFNIPFSNQYYNRTGLGFNFLKMKKKLKKILNQELLDFNIYHSHIQKEKKIENFEFKIENEFFQYFSSFQYFYLCSTNFLLLRHFFFIPQIKKKKYKINYLNIKYHFVTPQFQKYNKDSRITQKKFHKTFFSFLKEKSKMKKTYTFFFLFFYNKSCKSYEYLQKKNIYSL